MLTTFLSSTTISKKKCGDSQEKDEIKKLFLLEPCDLKRKFWRASPVMHGKLTRVFVKISSKCHKSKFLQNENKKIIIKVYKKFFSVADWTIFFYQFFSVFTAIKNIKKKIKNKLICPKTNQKENLTKMAKKIIVQQKISKIKNFSNFYLRKLTFKHFSQL